MSMNDNCFLIEHTINGVEYNLLVSKRFINSLVTKNNKVKKVFGEKIF